MAISWINSNVESNVKGTLTISCDTVNYHSLGDASLTLKYNPPENQYVPKRIIYSGKTTVVFWQDGTKTVVRCAEGEEFVPEIGVAEAIAEKVFGGSRSKFIKAVNRGYRQPATEEEKQQLLKEKAELKTKKVLKNSKANTK